MLYMYVDVYMTMQSNRSPPWAILAEWLPVAIQIRFALMW